MLIAAAYLLFEPMEANGMNILFILATYVLLQFTKISSPVIIAGGVILGILYNNFFL
jgi:chromate transporter